MVFGLLMMATAVPTVVGVNEATRSTKDREKREEREERCRKCHLIAEIEEGGRYSEEVKRSVNEKGVVLRDGKLYLESPDSTPAQRLPHPENGEQTSIHRFTGYFVPFPETKYHGLVSTITKEPPMLNWIYIDASTSELRYGIRDKTQGHLVGPWDWTDDERYLTLEGWEGIVAVEEDDGGWGLYFDREDDRRGLPQGQKVVEISLKRVPVKQWRVR
ncbi:MAG: hypothetical protein M1827_005286 [Pycnora praestabilis]|nr:MAG: hypothetical protein M1827_005286 [Pycnora praestabilis]